MNKPIDKYKYRDKVNITIHPNKRCYLYLYYVQDKFALSLHPPPNPELQLPTLALAGQPLSIPHLGTIVLRADDSEGGFFHLLALKNDTPPVSKEEWVDADPVKCTLGITAQELLRRIDKLKIENPQEVMHWEFEAPVAAQDNAGSDEAKETEELIKSRHRL